MGHYLPVREHLKTLKVKSQVAKQLRKDILAFWRSRPLSPDTKITKDHFLQAAQAFIDKKGASYFPTSNPIDKQKVLQSIAGIMQAQRRYDIDNNTRGRPPRRAMHRKRTPLDRMLNNRGEAGGDESLNDDSTEDHEGFSDPQDEESASSDQDPSWQPESSSTLGDKRKRSTRPAKPALGAESSQKTRHTPTTTQEAADSELDGGTSDHHQTQSEYDERRLQSTVSETRAASQSPDEIDVKPRVTESITFQYLGYTSHFKSVHQMARALDAVFIKVSNESQQLLESTAKEERSQHTALSYYYHFVFEELRESLLDNGATFSTRDATGDIVELSSDTSMTFRGDRWEFKSVEHKAEALGTAMVQLATAIEPRLAWIRKKDKGQHIIMDWHHKREYKAWVVEALCQNGAELGK